MKWTRDLILHILDFKLEKLQSEYVDHCLKLLRGFGSTHTTSNEDALLGTSVYLTLPYEVAIAADSRALAHVTV